MESLKVREVRCKTLLHQMSAWGAREYTANFFRGCAHACVYCYVPSLIHDDRRWGSFVDVKVNAPDVLDGELRRARKGVVFLSSATDPYQAVEARYRVTRRCLQTLLRHEFPVVILTRSPLVLRDVDLLRRFDWIRVGFSISSVSERFYEPRVAPLGRRIECLRRLGESGIKTWVSMAPIIPGLIKTDIRKVIQELHRAGVSAVSPGSIRFQGYPESKAMFEERTGHSVEGLPSTGGEGEEDPVAEARRFIREQGFESIDKVFEWHPVGNLDGFVSSVEGSGGAAP